MHLIQDPQFWFLVGCYWVFSAAVGALPMPKENDKPLYQWFFQFANSLAGNLSRAVAGKIPGLPGEQSRNITNKGDER